jgi:periplasmic protein TonB
MAPSAIAPEVRQFPADQHTIDFLPIPERLAPGVKQEDIAVPVKDLFKSALIEKNQMSAGSRTAEVVISVLLHVVVILTPILLSLFYTDTINLKQFTATLLVAPPPPPPPPAAAPVVKVMPVHRVFMNQGKLIAPRYVPQQIAQIKEAPLEADMSGAAGGVPGGVPGGQMGGVIGGMIGGVLGKGIVPVAPINPRKPIRIGGHIRAPKPVFQPAPVYPVIARQARVAGVVVVDAILDEQGNVVEMKIVSGPPLLYQAAMDALKQWRYEPTYLNDTPISVQMIVNVMFQLNGAS